MSAGEPRIFINHRRQPFRHFFVAAFPQSAERACRADNRQIVHFVASGDLRQLIRHARTASHAGDKAGRIGENPFEHSLRAAHFPQDVDVDRAFAIRHFVRALHLFGAAFDRIFDQLVMAPFAGVLRIGVFDKAAVLIIAIGVHSADRANTARCCPCARTLMIGRRNAFTAFDQRPDFASAIVDRANSLKQ